MARILVVDDSPDIVELVGFCLRRLGHDVVEATEPRAVAILMEHLPPDLLILDYAMPGLDGFELLRVLRAAGKVLPVIMISGMSTSKVEKIMPSSRSMRFLEKPLDLPRLQEMVSELLCP